MLVVFNERMYDIHYAWIAIHTNELKNREKNIASLIQRAKNVFEHSSYNLFEINCYGFIPEFVFLLIQAIR